MGSKPILYSYFRSSCSWRVRAALALKGIEYEYRAVDLVQDGGLNLKPEYEKLNPNKQVPLLLVDGHTLTQSLPIIEYLEETRPEPPLLPAAPFEKAKVREMCELINSGIQPIQNISVLRYLGADRSQEWGKHWITTGFTALEKMLQDTSGEYCFGDVLTIADVFLVPQVYNAARFSVDMADFPTISGINQRLLALDAFEASHPHCQPDTPPEFKK